ncbi:MAG: crossover junction endodeoxyribonuclease RuvC [Clostridia bacterium]|nr:crossover junction endodeoxyribonuclease RuvC [Bacillota bacterium]MBO2520569.1 crossover junction endodeoxyribonuclease RuvC [Bacillota bacterium]
MIIMGIDPGTATSGYGVVELRAGALAARAYGAIETPAHLSLPDRLEQIFQEMHALLEAHRPDAVAVEQLYFSRNTTTAFSVGQARGVFLLAAAQRKIPVAEYAPHQVKLAVTGEGRADKRQVAFMVRALLKLSEFPKPDDVADALAIAICHAHHHGASSRMARLTGGTAGYAGGEGL